MSQWIGLLCVVFLLFGFTSAQASGPSLGVSGRKEVSQGKEKTQALEKTKEHRKTTGARREKRKEETESHSLQNVARKALSKRKDSTLRITVSVSDLFFPVLASLEKGGIKPFGQCCLVTHPPRLSDLGIQVEVAPGLVDALALEYYNNLAASGGLAPLKGEEITRLVNCALDYSLVLGSALTEIQTLIKKVGTDWLGYRDLKLVAKQAVLKALRKKDKGVEETIQMARDVFAPSCRFRGKIDDFLCGGLLVSVRPSLTLRLGGLILYGEKFAGLGGEWTISAGWSLDQAWEKLVTDSKTKTLLKAWADYIERLEAKGETVRAALLKKKALLLAKEGKADILISPPF